MRRLAVGVVLTWILWMGTALHERMTWHPINTFVDGQVCADMRHRVQPVHPRHTFQCLPEGTVPDGYQPPTGPRPRSLR